MARKGKEVLNALDAAKTQMYHFTAIVIAGMGFFTDAYDLFSISLVTKLLGRIYYHVDGSKKPGTLPPNVAAAVNGVAFCGTLAGQLFFGWLGDKLGRKKVYGKLYQNDIQMTYKVLHIILPKKVLPISYINISFSQKCIHMNVQKVIDKTFMS